MSDQPYCLVLGDLKEIYNDTNQDRELLVHTTLEGGAKKELLKAYLGRSSWSLKDEIRKLENTAERRKGKESWNSDRFYKK